MDTYERSRFKQKIDFSTLVFAQIERINQAADSPDSLRYYNNVNQLEKMLRHKFDKDYRKDMTNLEDKMEETRKTFRNKGRRIPLDIEQKNKRNKAIDQFGFLMELIFRIGLLSREQRTYTVHSDEDEPADFPKAPSEVQSKT